MFDLLPLPRELLDQLDNGILVADAARRVVYANTAALRLLGRSVQRLENLTDGRSLWQRVLRGSSISAVHIEPNEHGGSPHPLVLSAGPIRDATGSVAGIIAVLRAEPRIEHPDAYRLDEMARTIASGKGIESIERRRKLLEGVLQHMPAGLLILGPPPAFRVLHANAHLRKVLDEPYRSRVDVIGRPFRDILPDIERSQIVALLEQTFASGETSELDDFTYRGFARGLTYWNARFVPLRDWTGTVEAVIVLLAETTDQVHSRRRIEELARTAAQQATALSAIIDAMAEGVYICDASGQVILVNDTGARLLGLTVEQTHQALSSGAETAVLRDASGLPLRPEEFPLARGLHGEASSDFEQIVRRADSGEDIYLRIAYSPIVDQSGAIAGAVAIASDVTRARQLERQREEFLSIAAHELKTPVTSIKLFAQGMLRTLHRQRNLSVERSERDLRTILSQIDRLANLVDDLLDWSRVRSGRLEYRFERLDLVALVRSVIERFEAQIESVTSHRLRLETDSEALAITGDWARLDQVFTNLISNAIKYSPDGGQISVWVGADAKTGWVRVSVTDQGIGLSPEEIDALFAPFARAAASARNISGIGLGLYISREIVTRHGGRIAAESAGRGAGATFVVELPPEQPAPPSAEPAVEPRRARPRRS